MVQNRKSIVQHAMLLAELVIEGGGNLPAAIERANKVVEVCKGKGVYRKQYASHEERVLNRHLNLYQNKLKAARTAEDRARWTGKIAEQKEKLAMFKKGGQHDLDLDGL